jgi:hypothetical protein
MHATVHNSANSEERQDIRPEYSSFRTTVLVSMAQVTKYTQEEFEKRVVNYVGEYPIDFGDILRRCSQC